MQERSGEGGRGATASRDLLWWCRAVSHLWGYPMSADRIRRRSTRRRFGALCALTAVCLTALTSVDGVDARQAPPGDAPGDGSGPKDRDNREGVRLPSAQQRALAAASGADVRWNRLGTPATVTSEVGVVADGLAGNPVQVARAWADENRALFGLSEQSVTDLELIYSAPLGVGRAVLFRQRFGDLPAGHDGLLTVGVRGDSVVFVSSTIA